MKQRVFFLTDRFLADEPIFLLTVGVAPKKFSRRVKNFPISCRWRTFSFVKFLDGIGLQFNPRERGSHLDAVPAAHKAWLLAKITCLCGPSGKPVLKQNKVHHYCVI